MKKVKAHERSQSLSKEGQEYGHKHRKRYKMRKKKTSYYNYKNLFPFGKFVWKNVGFFSWG